MQQNQPSRKLSIFALIAIAVIFLANSSNPPNGRTGAPGDNGTCAGCHSGSNPNGFDGSVDILNFPTSITPGVTYSLTAKVTNPNGNAVRGGFQAVVLNETDGNSNAGDLIVSGTNPTTVTSGGREYVEHNPALFFPANNESTWNFDWTAPTAPAGNIIKIYTSAVVGNGSGSSGDLVVSTSFSGTMEAGGGGDPLTVQITTSSDVLCFGENTGTATAEASDGAGSYSYSWPNGESGATATMLPAGPQTVTVTDAMSATATASVMIGQPSSPLTLTVSNQTDITCEDITGSATIIAVGGTPDYTFAWDNGENTATAINLTAGNHTVTVTDFNNCMESFSVFIDDNTILPLADAGPIGQLDCNNNFTILDGSNSDTGTAFVYLWTTTDGNIISGETTTSPVVDQAGIYTLTVTNNSNGCTGSASTTVTEIIPPSLIISGTDALCFGQNNGSISLTVNDGTMPFIFDWNDDNYDGIQNPSNLSPGTYAVTVTDAINCVVSTSIQIFSPSEILMTSSISSPLCNGECTAEISLVVTGGIEPYFYDWANGANTNPIGGLCAGNISVTVTDANGCTQEDVFTIAEPTAVSITGATTDALCGECNGSITTNTSGGIGSYTYDWGTGIPNTPNPSNLCPGTYTVTVTDNNNCTATNSYDVNSPSAPTISLIATSASCGACDGSISTNLTGGTIPFSFLWNTGSTSSNLNDLCLGDYSLTVTDGNNCTYVNTISVNGSSPITLSSTNTNISCFENCDGGIALQATGGSGNFSYQWSGGIPDDEDSPFNLCAGDYSVTVSDNNGCTVSESITLIEPAELTANSVTTNALCNGDCDGSISLTVNGGTEGYNFSWSNDSSNNSATNENLCVGTYTVIVTDANNCTLTLTEQITESTAIQLTADPTDETCNQSCDGSINTTTTGGTQPYTYLWSNGSTDEDLVNLCDGNYTLTVTDNNNCTFTLTSTVDGPDEIIITESITNTTCNNFCNGAIDLTVTGGTATYDFEWNDSAIENEEDPINLCAGNYTVTVTDDNNCTATKSFVITEPIALVANASAMGETGANANDGSATANPTGGTPNYNFAWSNNASTQTINNLSPGTYTLTITDQNNCTAVETVTVNSFDCDLITTIAGTNISCNGGSNGTATVTASGGNGNLSYDWSSSGNTSTETGLAAGSYTVTVTDADNCSSISNITLTEPAVLSLSISGSDPLCQFDCNGNAEVMASGGSEPYTFLWSNSSTDDQINNLCPGFYTVTVTDANACTESIDIELTEAPSLNLIMSSTNETFPGANDGTATGNVSGGTAGYTEQWNNGQNGQVTITGLAPGEYCVTITDSNNCSISGCVNVAGANCDLEITGTTNNNLLCNGDMSGSLTANTTGGINPISYSWSNNENTQTINNLPAGSYSVTATDNAGCSATFMTSLSEPAPLSISLSTTDVVCNGDCNGTATPSISGGIEPYFLSWVPAGGTADALTDLCPGTYTLFVTDNNNCTESISFDILEPTLLVATVTSTDETLPGANDGTALVESSGGWAPYTETWSNGFGGISIMNLSPGTYCVTITDNFGCTASNCTTISSATCDLIATINQTNISCNGNNDGTATVATSGGDAPFSYNWSSSSNNTNTETNLPPGVVSVTITDNLGCSYTQITNILEPTTINLPFTVTDESTAGAMDGAITVIPDGGSMVFTSYNWNNGANTATISNLSPGSYCVTVTDSNGCTMEACASVNPGNCNVEMTLMTNDILCFGDCNGFINATVTSGTEPITYSWSNGSMEQDISGLCAGDYTLTATDANNCEFVISETIMQFSQMINSEIVTDESSPGAMDGMIDLSTNGGAPPYDYLWPNNVTTQDLDNLSAGEYCVTVSDLNGCTIENCYMVESGACILALSLTETGASCFGGCDGSIITTVTNGAEPLVFEWSNSTSNSDANNLCAGSYAVTVTDANNCTIISNATISEPTMMTASAVVTDESAPGAMDGAIDLSNGGGSGSYSFSWSNSTFTQDLSNLSTGEYCVTITDSNDCTLTDCWLVNQVGCSLSIVIDANGNDCPADCNGTIDISLAGGMEPYTFNWSNGEATEDLANLCNGTYTVTATDMMNCTLIETITLSGNSEIMINEAVVSDATCFGLCDGMVLVNTTAGLAPFTYDWSVDIYDGMTEVSDLCTGIYDLTVTDGNGCTELLCFDISGSDEIIISTTTTEACFGECNGTVVINVTGGTSPYTYSIQPSNQLCAGDYNLVVTDALGCSATNDFTIIETPEILFNLSNIGNEIDGLSNGFFDVDISGGTAPYQTSWTLDGTIVSMEEDPTDLVAGVYNLVITDAMGCVISITDDLIIQSTTATTQQYVNKGFTLFPNPANELVYLLLETKVQEELEILIFDMSGKVVNPNRIKAHENQQWELNIKNLPIGVYTIQLKGDDFIYWDKLVKVNE